MVSAPLKSVFRNVPLTGLLTSEPCIRGHRSSKCQHFDRLMMKVPKAGRPLTKCPHPKGTCSCQKTYAFMVRIPKGNNLSNRLCNFSNIYLGSGCLCRPLYRVPAGANGSSQSTPTSMASVSSPSSGKVQKSGRRQNSIQATPENIAKALEAMPDNLKVEDGVLNYPGNISSQPSEQDDSNNTTQQAVSVPQESSEATNGSSCCSKKPQPPPIQAESSYGLGSCCSGKAPNSNGIANGDSNAQGPKVNQPSSWNDLSYMNFSGQQISTWQNSMTSAQEPSMPPFGMTNPRAQSFYMNQYPSNASTTSYSDAMNGLGITPPNMAPFITDHSRTSAYAPNNLGSAINHECNCGDECQCLGCAAHPFNNTTRQHVQEMGVMMTFDGDDSPDAMASAYQPPAFQGNAAANPANYFMQQPHSMDHGIHSSFEPYSDPTSAMPSGYSSPLSAGRHFNQQLMPSSEYYTIEYPVGIPSACSDVTGSCQCGNDCSCVGCLTHSGHNGVALDAPIPEATPIATTTEHVSSSQSPPALGAGSHTSRIPVLENVSTPCLSPRTLETSMI